MKSASVLAMLAMGAAPFAAAHAQIPNLRCMPDAVKVGNVCVDKYEASVWRLPAGDPMLIKKVQWGRVTLADLTAAAATQLCPVRGGNVSCSETCDYGETFPITGNWSAPLYAASVPGVFPTTCTTWFQAEQACRLSGKRLLTNEEWQAAAAGTPDPGAADDGTTTCATETDGPVRGGARRACVSSWGAHDMVGNVWEWVSDWVELAEGCTNWDDTFGGDLSCLGREVPPPTPAQGLTASSRFRAFDIFPVSPNLPGAIIRGGNFSAGTRNGVFAIYGGAPPHNVSRSTGFRCAR